MRIVACSHEVHAESILGILNEAIENSTAVYDYQPRPLSSTESWFRTKEAGEFPVIGIESGEGQLLEFASYGTFRGWPAYKYTVEHSVYVHRNHRGQGLGLKLMRELIAVAKAQERHLLVGGGTLRTKPALPFTVSSGLFTPAPSSRPGLSSAAGWIWPSISSPWKRRWRP